MGQIQAPLDRNGGRAVPRPGVAHIQIGRSQTGIGLLILGISARAAAFSARRAGYTPRAIDGFQDVDLAAASACVRIDRYPHGFERAAADFPPCPWLYTGGLENHPRVVDQIAARRTLLGNPGVVLREVRNPFRLAETLRREGLTCPDVSDTPPGSAGGTWLKKPRKSGGGQRIEVVSPLAREDGHSRLGVPSCSETQHSEHRAFYYQQFVSGTPCSAVFVAARGKAVCLGATRQLIGTAWTGAQGFEYAGSVGPLDLAPHETGQWVRIGNCLAHRFGLSGLFGVDAIMNEEAIGVVEVNPRYTASVEVLELACDAALLPMHVRACQDGELPPWGPLPPLRRVGKAIVYAERSGRVPQRFGSFVRELNITPLRPLVADIPAGGREFRSREPLVTVLAEAESLAAVEQSLQQSVAQAQAALECAGPVRLGP